MEYLQFTEFRNNSKRYFEQIEEGESFIIIRKGKPVARITPFENTPQGWKRPVERVALSGGKSTTDLIRDERDQD